jgi:hypothetical protein
MHRSGNLLQARPAFIFLLSIFFVWHGYVQDYPLVPVSDAVKLLLEYVAVSLLLVFLFYFIFKSWPKALAFAFFLMCIQFFFGATHDLIKNLFSNSFISRYSFLLPFVFVITGSAFVFFLKTSRNFKKATRYLSFTLAVLIAVDLVILISKLVTRSTSDKPVTEVAGCRACKRPNIYLVIADEYAGHEELHDIFSFDNSAFESELEKRNFHVVKKAMSNYNFTPYSMASIFDMNYLKGITNRANDINNRNTSYETINKNALVNTLTAFGYDFVNFSLFDFANKPGLNSNAFYSIREKLISSQTLTGRIKKDLWYHFVTTFRFRWAQDDWQKKFITLLEKGYRGTVAVAHENSERPRFVYTHFTMPHYPYLFDGNGRRLSFDESQQGGRKDLYLGYLQYCNEKCLGLIDSILKKDKTGPIVILMSDHGFTKYDTTSNDPSYNFKNMINVYFADKNYSEFPDTLSNVNLFRVILNKQFKQQLPLLKDSTIFLKEY